MSSIKRILLGLVLAAGALVPGQALADRTPTPQERSRIETMLRNEGFTRWGKIELDDDTMTSGRSTTPMPPSRGPRRTSKVKRLLPCGFLHVG
jgi:hypothetical protein